MNNHTLASVGRSLPAKPRLLAPPKDHRKYGDVPTLVLRKLVGLCRKLHEPIGPSEPYLLTFTTTDDGEWLATHASPLAQLCAA